MFLAARAIDQYALQLGKSHASSCSRCLSARSPRLTRWRTTLGEQRSALASSSYCASPPAHRDALILREAVERRERHIVGELLDSRDRIVVERQAFQGEL